jgi:predicted DnaQ family exonuclease/DinG family helicase
MHVFTVWVTKAGSGAPSFDVYPRVAEGQPVDAKDALYVTNDPAAFDGFFSADASRAISVSDLALFVPDAVPAPVPEPQTPAGKLWARWQGMEAKFISFPVWALKAIAKVFAELDEKGLSSLFDALAQKAVAIGKPETNWPETFPPMAQTRAAKRTLPSHEDCTQLDIAKVAAHLMPNGSFSKLMKGYESREGQVEMAKAVTRAFNEGKHLLVEAGTGVGKSLAYLVPAAAWARLNDVPVVISTNTRNLQTQLVEKDLPRVIEAFRMETGEKEPFRAALLKGRSNYFCLRRLGILLDGTQFELERPELRSFAEAIAWLVQSKDGDLDTFAGGSRCEPSFLSKVASTGEECPGHSCKFFQRCFLQKARAAAYAAHIVVVNHALVFAEARNAGSLLPPYAQIVFDEAHNLEEAATRFLSVEISLAEINQLLRRVSRGKAPHTGGLLAQIRRHVEKGSVTSDPETQQELLSLLNRARRGIDRIHVTSRVFFEGIGSLLPPNADTVRFKCEAPAPKSALDVADLLETEPLPKRLICREGVFVQPQAEWDELSETSSKTKLRDALAETMGALKELSDALKSAQADELGLYNDLSLGVDGAVATFREFILGLDFVWAASDPGYVYWTEWTVRSSGLARMIAAPLSIADKLNEMLYKQKASVVLCSATLRVGGSFNYINKRLGINLIEPGRVLACVAASPFDYLRQCAALAPAFLPDPAASLAKSGEYVEQLAALMLDVFIKTRGRALGLFTSYQMMNQVAHLLEDPLREAGIRLLVHGVDGTRDQITRIFRSGDPSVLLGTHSFWEGVDVAGEALSCVVMARLPFSAVGDPVVEARCEQIDQGGGSSFREFSLPLAVIRFRQGFGRLIRTKTDKGAVIIADPRLMTKNYGSVFRKSLPCPVRKADSREDLLRQLSALFSPESLA